jgi:hypothetical protein
MEKYATTSISFSSKKLEWKTSIKHCDNLRNISFSQIWLFNSLKHIVKEKKKENHSKHRVDKFVR